jgi:hypothetical protein
MSRPVFFSPLEGTWLIRKSRMNYVQFRPPNEVAQVSLGAFLATWE